MVKNVAIFIYEGVYQLDFSGPMEVFTDAGLAEEAPLFNVYTVSEHRETLRTHTGLQVIPAYSLNDCPPPDILVVPGGNSNLPAENKALADWLTETIPTVPIVMSVCTGAIILGKLGLLTGLETTTWHGALDVLQAIEPTASVKKGVRWTDNGGMLSTAGISAGIDGALHLVSRLHGPDVARRTAEYMDYDYWRGD
jgi:transcriptional regulator GlxA family with amidase domain